MFKTLKSKQPKAAPVASAASTPPTEQYSVRGIDCDPPTMRRGIAAGLVATVVAIVPLPLSLLVAAASEAMLVNKVFHLYNDYLYAMSAGDQALGAIAVAAGGLAACIATVAAQAVVPRAGRTSYVATSALGFAAIMAAAWLYGRHHAQGSLLHALGLLLAWICAIGSSSGWSRTVLRSVRAMSRGRREH